MNCDFSWLGWAEASAATFDRLGAKPFDVVSISLAGSSSGDYEELTTTVVQLVPRQCRKLNGDDLLSLQPVLCDYLVQSSEVRGLPTNLGNNVADDFVSIGPIHPYPGMACLDASEYKVSPCCWAIDRVDVNESDATVRLQITCLDVDADIGDSIGDDELEFAVSSALQGRWIMAGSSVVLSIESDENMVIAIIHSVNGSKDKVAYRLGTRDTFQVEVTSKDPNTLTEEVADETDGVFSSCPGYEALMASIVQLLSIQGKPSLSGLFLVGCSGVGKTRLLRSMQFRRGRNVYYVSLQEMLMQASCASEESLMRAMLPRKYSSETLWIVDDLDVLQVDGTTEDLSSMDQERRLLLNCLLLAIDRLVEASCKIIGAGHTSARLPVSIVKAGRLEKVVEMLPPTQQQREVIFLSFLRLAGYDEATCQRWSELLASATAGCVAGDIHSLAADACADALDDANTRPSWKNWKDASRACLPSQLASLDVKKPALHFDGESALDWLSAHERSWSIFRGYALLKRRIFRTVVAPWRRHLANPVPLSLESAAIAPPSGVLFHGPSGCGKSLAATCLGSALSLPMIKVRASDVLDKWLGGSEEAVRSLFVRARAAAPCILMFDEIDSIANNRGTSGESTDVMSRLLSTLLNEMDGVSSGRKDNVLVVACTNRLDSLDAAMLRPGRLEEHIELSLPTDDDALDILEHRFSHISTEGDVKLSAIATELVKRKVSAADLEGVVRESVYRCLRRCNGTENVTVKEVDVVEAINVLKI